MPLTFQQATAAATPPASLKMDVRRAVLYDLDFYRKGAGFLGPKGDPATADAIAERLERAFTPDDVLTEMADRRVDAVLALEPHVTVEVRRELAEGEAPTPEEQARIDAVQAAVNDWAENVAATSTCGSEPDDLIGVAAILAEMVYATSAFGASVARPFLPEGAGVKAEDGSQSLPDVQGDPARALRALVVDVLPPDEGVVATDRRTRERYGIATYEKAVGLTGDESPAVAEVSKVLRPADDGADGTPAYRTSGTEDHEHPDTLLGVVREDGTAEYRALPLRGRLHVAELRERTPYVDEVMLKLQDALNTASTEERIVNDDAGFPVRLLMGAMPPGEFKETKGPDGRPTFTFEPKPFDLGPGKVVNVQGTIVPDPEATASAGAVVAKSIASPSVAQWNAAEPKNYRDERASRRVSLLRRGRQLYVETTGDAAVSGESRIQALHDHLVDAYALARSTSAAGSHLLETAWHLACYLAAVPARDYDLAIKVNVRVTPPRMTPAEAQSVLRLLSERVWSRERAMLHAGVDDPQAEAEKIDREEADSAARIDAALASDPGAPGGSGGGTDGPGATPPEVVPTGDGNPDPLAP